MKQSAVVGKILATELGNEAEERYLNYALSVITSRALPDVRDGLKPVQRRLLYAMFQNLRLSGDARPRKSAAPPQRGLSKPGAPARRRAAGRTGGRGGAGRPASAQGAAGPAAGNAGAGAAGGAV